ncbi:alpha/beta hydrolase [Spirochaeta africana]|uniref:Putative lysophospholipase n=1 Tax=Spirochaeta africana (strain ATCC 700263 / DSM 8902 / Z-7692) TaxID=889378 RepID=H9UIW0_SPIAZ|nr:alpha/beta fold hydrolase [Spirochaeta africana]AFG37453.1 Putative lysophospholipase [Spirochaeta africana DSM 8902]
MRGVLFVCGALAVLYIAAALLLAGCQTRILYQPHMGRGWIGTPDQLGLEWESIQLEARDGVELDAWWVRAPVARGALVFFHGNAGNISHRLESIRQFTDLGLSVFIIDYRGYGRSQGRPSEEGTALDARAAWDWMQRYSGYPAEQTVIFGRSLGAAVAAELARDVQSAAVILESSFRSVPALARSLYPWLPVGLLLRYDYPVEQYVAEIDAPLLVIHSREDEIVPFAHGRAVYEAARPPREFMQIQGGHNTGFRDSEPEYSQGINRFLADAAGLAERR